MVLQIANPLLLVTFDIVHMYIRTLSYSHEQTDYHNRIIIISAKVFVWANELRGRAGGYYTMYLSE